MFRSGEKIHCPGRRLVHLWHRESVPCEGYLGQVAPGFLARVHVLGKGRNAEIAGAGGILQYCRRCGSRFAIEAGALESPN